MKKNIRLNKAERTILIKELISALKPVIRAEIKKGKEVRIPLKWFSKPSPPRSLLDPPVTE